jgi:ferredoxin
MKLRLTYEHDRINRPVLANTIIKTGVPINILEAQVTSESGQLIVDVPVNNQKLNEIIKAFKAEGVKVQEIISTLTFDLVNCTSCGACVSPCPTSAITQNSDWTIAFDDKKCIRCKVCVDACPVKVISIS